MCAGVAATCGVCIQRYLHIICLIFHTDAYMQHAYWFVHTAYAVSVLSLAELGVLGCETCNAVHTLCLARQHGNNCLCCFTGLPLCRLLLSLTQAAQIKLAAAAGYCNNSMLHMMYMDRCWTRSDRIPWSIGLDKVVEKLLKAQNKVGIICL